MRANWKRIVFQVVGTLLAIEIVLRIIGVFSTYSERTAGRYESYYGQVCPTWYHVWHPDSLIVYDEPEIKCSYRANSMGLREVEIPPAKKDSVKRLFFIGDSFTEGDGVSYPYSMPRFFEKKLDSAGLKFEVFNAGVCGSDPFYEYTLLRDKLLPLHPDAVIISINESDITDYIFRGGMERFQKDGTTVYRKGPWWQGLYKYSRIVRVLTAFFGYDDTFLSHRGREVQKEAALHSILECLYQVRDLCALQNIKLFCVLQPDPSSFNGEVEGADEIEAFSALVPNDSLPFINLYPGFRRVLNKGNYKNYSLKINGHFNRQGYKLYSDILFKQVNMNYPAFLH